MKTKSLLLCAVLVIMGNLLFAELVFNYSLMKSISETINVSDGTVLGDSQNNDISFNNLPIGFEFTFNGQSYQQISVNSNGYIVFGTSADNSYCVLANGSNNQVFAGLNTHLVPRTGTNPGNIQIKTIGQSPTRKCIIQWKHYKRIDSSATEDLNFQIILTETYNTLRVDYNQSVYGQSTNANLVYVGLRGLISSDLYNLSTSTDWWDTNCGASSLDGCLLTSSVYPLTQFSITFEPSNTELPPTCAEISFPQNEETGVGLLCSLGWSYSGNVMLDGYKINLGTNNPPSNILNNRIINQAMYSLVNLVSPNTTYYWQVIPYNSNGDAFNCPIWSFTTGNTQEALYLPYNHLVDDCLIPNLNQGVLSRDENQDGISWISVSGEANTGDFAYSLPGNLTQNKNDWLIFPPFYMNVETNYKIKFYAKTNAIAGGEQLRVSLGTSNNAQDMSLTDNSQTFSIISNAYFLIETIVTPTEDGIYYVGVQGFTPAQGSSLFIDDIDISEIGEVFYPPRNLSSQIVNGSVLLSWDAPEEGEPNGYRVYRDDVLLNSTLLTMTNYTDTNPLASTAIYHVTAVYVDGEVESGPSNQISVSLTANQDCTNNQKLSLIKSVYPNPFNPRVQICYELPSFSDVNIDIFNVKGQRVNQQRLNGLNRGLHHFVWNGTDFRGNKVGSGVYTVRLSTSQQSERVKVMLIK